jgi:hypothetical protein
MGGVWRWLSRNPLPVVLYCLEKGGQSGVSGDVGGVLPECSVQCGTEPCYHLPHGQITVGRGW